MSLRRMSLEEKFAIMESFQTAKLVADLEESEKKFTEIIDEQRKFLLESSRFLSGRTDDCTAVKQFMSELSFKAPARSSDSKSMNETEKKAWLETQRKENKELAELINKQKMAEFRNADLESQLTVTKVRIERLKGVLGLRTAQIYFFAGDIRTTSPEEEEVIELSNTGVVE